MAVILPAANLHEDPPSPDATLFNLTAFAMADGNYAMAQALGPLIHNDGRILEAAELGDD